MDNSTPSLNPQKLRYKIVCFPSYSTGYPPTELENGKASRGWQSAKNPDFPIEIGLMLENVSHIQKIQFLSHQYKITSSLDILVGNLPPPFDVSKITPQEDYKRAHFKLLGFMHLDDNSNTGFRARELKSVSVSSIGLFLKIILHKNHENIHNESNQVALVAINVFGDQVQFKPDLLPLPETYKSHGNAGTPAILKQNLPSNLSIPSEEIARPITTTNQPSRTHPKINENVETTPPQTQTNFEGPKDNYTYLPERKEDFKVSNISSMDDDDSDIEEEEQEGEEEEENTETLSNEIESNESEVDETKQIRQMKLDPQIDTNYKKEIPTHNLLREQTNPSHQQPHQQQQQQQASYIPQHHQHQLTDSAIPQATPQQIEPKPIPPRQLHQPREEINRPNAHNAPSFDLLSWLTSVCLPEYYHVMLEQGYDNPIILGMMDDEDLKLLGVVKPGHIKLFKKAINDLNPSLSTNALPTNTNIKPHVAPTFLKQEDTARIPQQHIPHVAYTLNTRPSTAQTFTQQQPPFHQKYPAVGNINPYASIQQRDPNPRDPRDTRIAGMYGMASSVAVNRYHNREARAIIDLSMENPAAPSYANLPQNYLPPQKYTQMYSRHEQDEDVEPIRNTNRQQMRNETREPDPHQGYQEESHRPLKMNNRNIQSQDYDYDTYPPKSNSPSPPPPARAFHNPADDRPLPTISKAQPFQDLPASIQSMDLEKRRNPPKENREREKVNNHNDSQEDERPRSVVGPNGELPPPSPLSEKKRIEAAPLLNIWNETIITCLYSRTWALRQKALEDINDWLKAGGDDSSDADQVFKGCCTILAKCLEDKYPQIYLASLAVLSTLLSHYSPLANISSSSTRSLVSPLLAPIVAKLGDSNTRMKESSFETLFEMSKILPNMIGPYYIAQSVTRPVKSQVQHRPVLGRLLLLKKLISEYGLGTNNSDETVDLEQTCTFISAAFESPNSEVRNCAAEALGEVYRLKEKRANQIMSETKSKLLKEVIANEFAKIDQEKGITREKTAKGESSAATGAKKKTAEPENKKKVDRENNPKEGGNISKSSSEDNLQSPKKSCQFCGETSPRFAITEHMDLHYMQLCPVLTECGCSQVVEIQTLNEHKLHEHEEATHRACKNCKEAIPLKEIASHQKECHATVPSRTTFDICPLF
eukprot:TRINITY_DN3703_c0_g1_i4.p1 TRINITY_DN3703_c0_g1~~TRINITY_DN3703_c0_g1_i4.p1  ORF type:complete len:1159 (+),score=270.12 TRINITY_DN3703_c0_g1_i4:187-3663(+)